jgi:protein translocase SEC61 complex gamma subunit
MSVFPAMNISGSIRELVNTLKYSKKSDSTEFSLYLKLVTLGVGVVGGVAFVIHVIASIVGQFLTPTASAAILTALHLVA